MKKSQNSQTDFTQSGQSYFVSVQKEALINTASALRSINSQYELTPEKERGEVSEINKDIF